MRVAIIGGNLQGVEAAYLSRKAGWETLLLDKRPVPPAKGLCDCFVQHTVSPENLPNKLLKGADVVLPAFEDLEALTVLVEWGHATGIPVAFNLDAYAISTSKRRSDRLFKRMGFNVPAPWPECDFPVIVKPDNASGSHGVHILADGDALTELMTASKGGDSWVIQEFVPGPSFSIEVIGGNGHYTAFQVTDLFMDAVFDCKRVMAPTTLPAEAVQEFERLSLAIAGELNLTGIMDVEVIHNDNKLKVLEIDARLPSQTPTAVYWSTGVNLVEQLGKSAIGGNHTPVFPSCDAPRFALYEHIQVGPGIIEVAGEHIMSQVGSLQLQKDFWGADEALTNYKAGQDSWVATLIYSGMDPKTVMEKRHQTMRSICKKFRIEHVVDSKPDED